MGSKNYSTRLLSLVLLTGLINSTTTQSIASQVPVCVSKNGKPLPVNATEVIKWKHSTPNQFESRAHIQGKISKLYENKNGHRHFEVTFSNGTDEDAIEIVYNEDFGEMPKEIELDTKAEVCGDYITATAVSGPYPPSPDGAIIHWVHQNPAGKGHPDGFVILNGALYGFGRKASK